MNHELRTLMGIHGLSWGLKEVHGRLRSLMVFHGRSLTVMDAQRSSKRSRTPKNAHGRLMTLMDAYGSPRTF